MTSYTIIDKQGGYIFITEENDCVSASSVNFLIGLSWQTVLAHCHFRGFTIVPDLPEAHTHSIEWHGVTYKFYWSGERISRIVEQTGEDEKEIRWSRLPEAVRKMI